MQPDGELVFVYGTLKRGGRYHEVMASAGGSFLGTARITGRLVSLGDYPGLLPGDGIVRGEVYRVPASHLHVLDRLEDWDPLDPAGSEYERRWTPLDDGPVASAWVYWYNPARLPPGFEPLTGDWPVAE
jgi:gamma-glutamylcyclotransferase (GGCT)/AIG2-like uncharacterized protein YtfP